MSATPPYAAALSKLAGAAQPNAMGAGMGEPPAFEGALPAATGVGAMPIGTPGSSAKSAADQAILALREASGFYPSLAPALNGVIDQLKSAAQQAGAKPTTAIGNPSKLGSAPPPVDPVALSGSPGDT